MKGLFCAECCTLRTLPRGNLTPVSCDCGNVTGSWLDGSRGSARFTAKRPAYAHGVGLNNLFISAVVDSFGMSRTDEQWRESVDDIASATQARAGRIRERTALLQLPNAARDALQRGRMTLGAAEQLLKLRDHPELIEKIVAHEFGSDYAHAALRDEPVRSFYQVDMELQRLQREKAVAEAKQRAEKQGLTVVDEPAYNRKKSDPQKIGAGYDDLHIDAKGHVGKPCHAVAITSGGKLIPVCTKPSKHAKEVAATKPASSSTTQRQDEPDDVQRAEEARFTFVEQLLQRAPHALAGALPMLLVLGRSQYDDQQAIRLLGLDSDGKRYSADSSKRFATWLVGGDTISEGEPHVDAAKLAAAAAACTWVAIQEAAYDHDPLMAFLIRTLQCEGYEPNAGELALLEQVPKDAAAWFA